MAHQRKDGFADKGFETRYHFWLVLCLTSRCGLQRRVPLTLPLPSAVARADALEQVPPIIFLAPGVSDSVGRPGVLVIASVCIRKEAFQYRCHVKLGKCQSQR